jgi:hypothetical protein
VGALRKSPSNSVSSPANNWFSACAASSIDLLGWMTSSLLQYGAPGTAEPEILGYGPNHGAARNARDASPTRLCFAVHPSGARTRTNPSR